MNDAPQSRATPIQPTLAMPRWLGCMALLVSALWVGVALAPAAHAQAPMPLPHIDVDVNGAVRTLVRQSNGGIVFGGDFTTVNGVARGHIARLLPNGLLDPDWNPSADASVRALAVDGSDAVYVGGWFTSIGGQSRLRIAKLAAGGTGAANVSWNPSASSPVSALAVDSVGAVYAGGTFTSIGGYPRSHIAKLSGSGTGLADANWNPSANAPVRALVITEDNVIYAGGEFTFIGGHPRRRIARLSNSGTGAADADWNPSATDTVHALALDHAGNIYAGGDFNQIGGQMRNRIAKLSSEGQGSADPSWNPSANETVWALAVTSGDAVFVGGNFSQIGGQARMRIAKLWIGGTGRVDADWNPGANTTVWTLLPDGVDTVVTGGAFTTIGGQARTRIAALHDAKPAPAPLARPDLVLNSSVYDIARQPNGGLILVGDFTAIDGIPRHRLARIRPDGSLDPDWTPWADQSVHTVAVDRSGNVYVGGWFTSVNGFARNHIAKISGSGTGIVDPAWNPAPDDEVDAVSVADDGSVYAAGVFTSIGGLARHRIAKLSGSGTGAADANWDAPINGLVHALVFGQDGALYVGGWFTSIGGQARSHIARLSGESGLVDPDWNPAVNGGIRSLAVDNNGAVYAGGAFTQINGQPRHRLARLQPDGSLDPDWRPSADGEVLDVSLDSDGSVFVGGRFGGIDGLTRSYLAKLSTATGAVDRHWNPSPHFSPPAPSLVPVSTLNAGADGIVYVGGGFGGIGGQMRARFAALPSTWRDPTPLPQPDLHMDGSVYAVARQTDGGLVIGGAFTLVNGVSRSHLARLRPDGSLDPHWNPGANNIVRALAVADDGAVYAGGAFTQVGGYARSRIVKLSGSGTGDVVADWSPPINDIVFALTAYGDAVYAGGAFTQVDGVTRNRIAKLSGSGEGTVDAAWNPSASSYVYALSMDRHGALYVGGDFEHIGGLFRARIAKLSGTGVGHADPNWNPSADGWVRVLAQDGNDALYVGGDFTHIGGQPRQRIARLSTGSTGLADPDWNPSADGWVAALALDGHGALYLGGEFTRIGGLERNRVARIETGGTGQPDPNWNPSVEDAGWVRALAIDGQGAVHIGGEFTRIAGRPRLRFAAVPGGGSDRIFADGFE